MIIYISGGARSGKSNFAQEMALKLSPEPVYVATAKVWDEDFAERVARHKQERGPEWTSIEAERNIHLLPIINRVAVIDCVTLWLTNLFIIYEEDIEKTLIAFKAEIDGLLALSGTFIIISNEIGMGVHAATEMGRKFTDLQGWANQYVASKAEEAIFMVSGLPLWLKKSSQTIKP
ncbi:bifunctional adenosylcobinamide kinase/adenosylcobinamide-phosphate guanylyltransferase [Dyadobacter sp. CY107]|uniref:bifunctional adenosylcobinamide kinase/adenosylcobinamide-phosphate guanylyltransferase n=1 Tax=Dyadobacter fanqingshengii TaxID=2906443 RepID=UPI001F3C4156|nr:bifunctional adenosylcobinamide kinase/adenosylcobinamide-phosphate guanylyltransferase [Dyadobacter fanqingshengii]MCF2501898.1 bifunctional adenosylcobinamide kinase/adenosylcobinamide-phosphate guanylyltransferase [Dyadobacter fanqingshengii]